jgi:hypothetical protein
MMNLNPYAKAALAALCIGVGVALFASAVHDVKAPCVGCEDDAEETVGAVAAASAEMDKIMEALDGDD